MFNRFIRNFTVIIVSKPSVSIGSYFKVKNINETTLKYFEFSLTYIHNDSVILFENIHSDKESEKIWNHIKNNKKVTVTIDTFFWGFVFFRKEQEKEHFIIRI